MLPLYLNISMKVNSDFKNGFPCQEIESREFFKICPSSISDGNVSIKKKYILQNGEGIERSIRNTSCKSKQELFEVGTSSSQLFYCKSRKDRI